MRERKLMRVTVSTLSTLYPSNRMKKNRLTFHALADGKEYFCIVWGKTALDMRGHIHLATRIYIEGFLLPENKIVVDRFMLPRFPLETKAMYDISQSKLWTAMSKVPGLERLFPVLRPIIQKRKEATWK